MRSALILGLWLSAEAMAQVPAPRADTNGFPYARLFTTVNSSAAPRAINNLIPAERDRRLAELARWYGFFYGDSLVEFPFGETTKGPGAQNLTLAARLAQKGAVVSNHRNGSEVSAARRGSPWFGEAADLETRAPLAIATWWPGQRYPSGEPTNAAARLALHVDIEASTLRVTGTARVRPQGAPVTWPFLPSRGRGATPGNVKSDSTADFVSWVRVDDEIVRVRSVAPEGANIVLSVDRAYFGTAKTVHTNGTRVLLPVYIGSVTGTVLEKAQSGSPPQNSPLLALRYGIKVWQDEPNAPLRDGVGWLATRLAATFGAGQRAPYLQGYNAVWLEASACSTQNAADAYGQPVAPWDDARGYALTPDGWGDHQATKVRGLRARLTSLGYTNVQFTVNSVAATAGAGADCRTRLLASAGVDGGSLEHWLQNPALWDGAMNQHLSIQAQDLPALYWVKWNDLPVGATAAQHKRFAYGSYLLGMWSTATRARLGGPFGLGAPDELFFWNLGAAVKNPRSLAELQTEIATRPDGTGAVRIYRREFANGFVLVNPTRETLRCNVRGNFLDATQKDAAGKPAAVKFVELAPYDAALLIKAL